MVDQAFTKEMGPFVAINDLRDSTGNPSTGTITASFEMGGQEVEPQYNVYSIVGKTRKRTHIRLAIRRNCTSS